MSLEGRTVVISGATGGLGMVVARELAQAGASMVLFGRSRSRLEGLAAQIGVDAARLLLYPVELQNIQEVREAARATMEHFGRVDILLHLAGGWVGGHILVETDSADLGLMLDQHIWTTFHLIQAFTPHLVRNGWGRILVVSAPVTVEPPAKSGAYAVGKAGEEALILTLAKELRGTGVTANVLQVRAIDEQGEKRSAPSPNNADWNTPEEISAVMRLLFSDEGGVISGLRLPLFNAF